MSDRVTFQLDDAGALVAKAAMETGKHDGRRVIGIEYDVAVDHEPTVTIRLEPKQ